MVSVRSNDEIYAKQIEVKATGASDVKIYANGASQRAGGNDTTDNSIGKTNCLPGGCVKPAKGNSDLFGINKPKKNNPFGNFDKKKKKKLDPEELAAMKAYVEAMLSKKPQKADNVNKPNGIINPIKPNNDFMLILIGMLIAQMLQQQQQNNDFLGNNGDKAAKKPLLQEVA